MEVRNTKTFTIPEGHQLSIHFNIGSLILLQGEGKIMGAPITRNARFNFDGKGVPVVAHSGPARIEVAGDYVAKPVVIAQCDAAELHHIFQIARNEAKAKNAAIAAGGGAAETAGSGAAVAVSGPRVLVVGDVDTGKSSLCKTLINMAVSSGEGHAVSFVDVDVGQSAVSIPGCVAATFVEGPLAIDDEFNLAQPLAFYFGDKTVPGSFKNRYLNICSYIKECIASVGEAQPGFKSGGVIVNTMGWVTGLGYSLIQQLIDVLEISHVVVTGGNEALFQNIKQDVDVTGRKISVMTYGCPRELYVRSKAVRSAARSRELLKYFIGTKRTPLTPCRLSVNIKDICFLDAMTFQEMQPADLKPLQVAAISHAPHQDGVESSNLAGFVVILDVSRTQVTLLTPSPGPLPRNILLVSTTILMEKADVPQIM